jgi:hypothetical protein
MQAEILRKVEGYLRAKFENQKIGLRPSNADPDMAEVYIGEEFVGTLYRDEDGGEISFDFNMSIIDIDLK